MSPAKPKQNVNITTLSVKMNNLFQLDFDLSCHVKRLNIIHAGAAADTVRYPEARSVALCAAQTRSVYRFGWRCSTAKTRTGEEQRRGRPGEFLYGLAGRTRGRFCTTS